jgi:hypothetical protein
LRSYACPWASMTEAVWRRRCGGCWSDPAFDRARAKEVGRSSKQARRAQQLIGNRESSNYEYVALQVCIDRGRAVTMKPMMRATRNGRTNRRQDERPRPTPNGRPAPLCGRESSWFVHSTKLGEWGKSGFCALLTVDRCVMNNVPDGVLECLAILADRVFGAKVRTRAVLMRAERARCRSVEWDCDDPHFLGFKIGVIPDDRGEAAPVAIRAITSAAPASVRTTGGGPSRAAGARSSASRAHHVAT